LPDNPNNSKGITIAGARYASEDAATLVHYVIAILEYSKLCGPLKDAKSKVEKLKNEQAEYEKGLQEKEIEVFYKRKLNFELAKY
jgi:dynein heavy chain, axonemal